MSREIRFRAWDKNQNTMIYPVADGLIRAIDIDFTFEVWANGWECQALSVTGKRVVCGQTSDTERNDGILMQYTGLKDKNGVEIYEGDICHTDYFKDNGWNTKAFNENQEVKFEDGAFQLGDFTTLYECTSNHEYALEVIGNIMENAELLK